MITFIQLLPLFYGHVRSQQNISLFCVCIFFISFISFMPTVTCFAALSIWTTITLFYGGPVLHSRWCHFFVMIVAHLNTATYSNSCHFHTCFYDGALEASRSRQNLGSKSWFFITDIRPAVLVFSSDYNTGWLGTSCTHHRGNHWVVVRSKK